MLFLIAGMIRRAAYLAALLLMVGYFLFDPTDTLAEATLAGIVALLIVASGVGLSWVIKG
jgi:hypothetical protein